MTSNRLVGAATLSVTLAVAGYWIGEQPVSAQQSPHGGANVTPQPGPNTNAAGGVVDLADPAAFVKSDVQQQRQNETVIGVSVRNPDHLLAAANDYRFVDFPQDQFFGGQMNFFTRLLAKLFGRPTRRAPERAAISVGAWTGIYRSCDRGRSWIGSALPGGPLDSSEASLGSPLKQLSNLAQAQGGHAETTDPVLVAGPDGRMHVAVLGFVRFATGVGESRMYYASYTDRNNREGGTCFNYDFTREIDRSTFHVSPQSPAPFLDKPSIAVDKDGMLYVAYTVFTDAVKSKIVVARSSNGVTWTGTTPLFNVGLLRNHGTTLAVDQLNGTVYLAWRLFYEDWPLMVISKSYDRGRTFLPATPISHWWPAKSLAQIVQQLKAAKLRPFDQFTSQPPAPVAARSLAFPHLVAGVVNGKSKLFAVWTERADVNSGSPTFGQPHGSGSPRIMFSMSSDGGWSWTARRAIDAGPRTEHLYQPGVGPLMTRASRPQLQPILNISGRTNTQLLLLYYEARDELDQPFETNFVSGIARQVDVRIARINPANGQLVAPSVQISQYPIKTNSSPAALAETAPGFAKVHRPNEMMYQGGFAAFFGDYPFITSSTVFEKGSSWTWAVDPSPVSAIWTDHRDVQFPINPATGLPDINAPWTGYKALKPIDPNDPNTPTPTDCTQVATRNANPYFAEVAGVVAGSPQTFKPLTIQRAFVTYVENRTPQDRFFRLTIQDNEASGLDGSFDQFSFTAADDARDIHIFANSSQTRTVWVQPFMSNPTASVRILVREISGIGGSLVNNGLSARVVLNPDSNNNPLLNVPPLAPEFPPGISIDDSEIHNPQISTPQISTFRVTAPQISSPQISTPQISTPQISTPQISTPGEAAPQISSPQISTPQISTAPPGEENGTDVTYTVTNQGNTTTTYDAIFNVPNVQELIGSGNYQFQVLVTRTSLVPGFVQATGACQPAATTKSQVVTNVPVPQISSPQISTIQNPQISTPQISTPQISTFSLAPAGGAEGQNSHGDEGNEDAHSTVLPDEVKLTLRAIRLRPLAAGGPLFIPATVVAKVKSESTNVIEGVVQEPGTEPEAFTEPDLVVANYTPASPALMAPAGGQVTLSAWRHQNQGTAPANAADGTVSNGFYLSTDAIITASDVRLDGNVNTNSVLPAGGGFDWGAPTLTIPPGTAAGNYFIGILVDELNEVMESDEGNNYFSEPIMVTAAGPQIFVVTNTNDSGPGSLRQAILDSNARAEITDTIRFNILEGPQTIVPVTPLPGLNAVVIDATANGACVEGVPPAVRIDGASAGVSHGLVVSAGGTTIRGLSITRFQSSGIFLAGGGSSIVECNYLGLASDGLTVAGNTIGLRIGGSNNNLVGGSAAAARNVISGNIGNGVEIQTAGTNQVSGNYIGTDATGTVARPNLANGVQIIDAPANTVGGATAAARNVISGNGAEGVRIDGAASTGNIVSNNYVGLDASGTLDLGNNNSGVYIRRAHANLVQANSISGNNGFAGVAICGNLQFCGGGEGPGTDNAAANLVLGNLIGTNAAGSAPVGNQGYGVSIDGAPNTVVGGSPDQGNVIANNVLDGVVVFNPPSSGNMIRFNHIFANGALGIDLIEHDEVGQPIHGITQNDLGDPPSVPPDLDAGSNDLQNFPVLSAATSSESSTTVGGALTSTPNTEFIIDFYSSAGCDPSGNGEGQNWFASIARTTDAAGNVSFSATVDAVVAPGAVITALAVAGDSSTSEFSNCVVAEPQG